MKPQIAIPNPNTYLGNLQLYNKNQNIVIIGSNGAGKTRFGVAIEQVNQSIIVHRISAQKNLSIPFSVQPTNTSENEQSLFSSSKYQIRWNHQSQITSSSNDYDKVIALLFSKSADRDQNYTNMMRSSEVKLDVPDSPIDILKRIWDDVIPNKQLTFDSGRVSVNINGSSLHASEMSDGERVILYLIAQCLIAPANSVVIIDEPELHLHKALVNRLWNAIENYCPNKLFIYITHDLDFAASKQNAYKIWLKSFNDNVYDWIALPESNELPEELLFQVIGSKKNVIFVEGEKGSLDIALYQAYYNDYLVIPMTSCRQVIEATKSIRATPSIHHIRAYGIIDRDYRATEEISAFQADGIYTIDVAEVENLLCTEGILRLVAVQQMLNPEETIESVINYIITSLQRELETQIVNMTEREVRFRLSNFKKISNSKQGIIDGLSTAIASTNTERIYNQNELLYQSIITNRNLAEALKYYNRKTLAERISGVFNLSSKEYPNLVIRLLNSDKRSQVLAALQPYLPVLPA